ncbi:hypothetical protein [Photobacterium leiognathi]|uniref:hypothetical protein n=1 Tax=Photobacterium leiognathi TaxID=553611 RepID=UPI002981BB66|nr:hypothetical protein [Photobacterium leiognathi]
MAKKKSSAIQIYNVDEALLELMEDGSNADLALSTETIMQLADFTQSTGWLGWGLPQVSKSGRGTLMLELALTIMQKVQSGELNLQSNAVAGGTFTQVKEPTNTLVEKNVSKMDKQKENDSTQIIKNTVNNIGDENKADIIVPKVEPVKEDETSLQQTKPQRHSYPIQASSKASSFPDNEVIEPEFNEQIKKDVLNAFN